MACNKSWLNSFIGCSSGDSGTAASCNQGELVASSSQPGSASTSAAKVASFKELCASIKQHFKKVQWWYWGGGWYWEA